MEGRSGGGGDNWSAAVEDLVVAGNLDGAISLLESVVSSMPEETLVEHHSPSSVPDLRLASALTDLANLYSSKGISLKADHALSRASLISLRGSSQRQTTPSKEIAQTESVDGDDKVLIRSNGVSSGHGEFMDDGKNTTSSDNAPQEPSKDSSDDDWEAIADRPPDELLSSQCLPGVSKLSLEDSKAQVPKRRGRGTFSYKRNELYSDQLPDGLVIDIGDDVAHRNPERERAEKVQSKHGMRHVLVLADFPPSTKTVDLEKLFENFRDRGVSIQWVNDTVALAVFGTPSIALEAYNLIHWPFNVRILDKDDTLVGSIATKNLEPPRPRPQTSARTAQRLIVQGMGLKLPSTDFGSRELRRQEEARKNRITSRHVMKDDAWGSEG